MMIPARHMPSMIGRSGAAAAYGSSSALSLGQVINSCWFSSGLLSEAKEFLLFSFGTSRLVLVSVLVSFRVLFLSPGESFVSI
jgi:hypothetical protein